MTRTAQLASMFVFVLLAITLAPAAEPSKYSDILGTWALESQGQNGQTNRTTLIVKEEGGKLTATSISDRGEFQPKEVKYENGELTQLYTFEREGKTYEIISKARPTGDTLAGKIDFKGGDQPRTFEFQGKRIAKPGPSSAALVGTWKLKLSLQDGTTAEPTLTITEEGGALKGRYTSQRFGDLPVTDIKFENGKLSFKVTAKTDQGSGSLNYHGDVTGQQVKGKADFDFGGQTGAMDFEGRKQEK